MKKNIFLKYSFILVLMVVSMVISHAKIQAPPYKACFSVSTNRGCVPLMITVTSCSPSGSGVGLADPIYNYDFANNPAAGNYTQTTTHTYTVPGVYSINQIVNNGVVGNDDTTITVTVLAIPLPTFKVDICQGNTVHVKITDNTYDTYTLDYGDGTIVPLLPSGAYTTHLYASIGSQTIKLNGVYSAPGCTGPTSTQSISTISSLVRPDMIDLTVLSQNASTGSISFRFYAQQSKFKYQIEQKIGAGAYSPIGVIQAASSGIISYTINNLNTLSNSYFYRVQNIDDCGNGSAYSDELSSIIVTALAQNNQNQISWIGSGFNTFDLNSDKGLSLLSVASPKVDSPIKCGDTYCYTVTGNYSTTSTYTGGKQKSYSAAVCTTAFSLTSPPGLTSVNCAVENAAVHVAWNVPVSSSVSKYQVKRSENGAAFVDYATTTTNSFIDATVNTAQNNYCYQVSYTDLCTNSSPVSSATCQVVVKAVKNDDVNNVSWTAYSGYLSSSIKEYVLELLDENGSVIFSRSAGNALSYIDQIDPTITVVIYRIKVVLMGVESLIPYSNTFRIDLSPQIFVPNTFSPNGDGTNDDFVIKGKYFKDFKMTILNRWGEVVYYTEDVSKGWDGKYKGTQADADSYAYAIEAKDNSGKEISKKGIVTIVR